MHIVDVPEIEGDLAAADPGKVTRRSYQTKLAHPTYAIEICPNCQFPEADGGYCAECGWSLTMRLGPQRAQGRTKV